MADVTWIKIDLDMFNNRKIKQIGKLPSGDSIIVIWFRLLCIAGNVNDNGIVYFTRDLPYTEEMLSIEFDKDIKLIRLALDTFKVFNMIEMVNNFILVSNWEKYQNEVALEGIREYNREKKREQRQRQKDLLLIDNKECQGQVIDCQGTDNISISNNTKSLSSDLIIKENKYKDIIDYLNLKSKKNFRIIAQTKKLIDVRLKEGFEIDDFYKVIDNQCEKWLSDEKMIDYLRPQTLFSNKFESYLNTVKKKKFNIMDL